jgi:CRP-like cAMP-binding protein
MSLAQNFDARANRLLGILNPADFGLLAPHLHRTALPQGLIVQEQETSVERVLFPVSGVISLVSVMEDGALVETASIGRDGAVGAFGGLGPWHAFTRAVVQLPGVAAVMPVSAFQAAVAESNSIRNLVLRYKEGLLAQVQQTAACNALHDVEQRLARWLLQLLDRTDGETLLLTQDLMARMLAVRRTTVTATACKLQDAGLISYHRGRIIVRDRPRLEQVACECYAAIRRRTDVVHRAFSRVS